MQFLQHAQQLDLHRGAGGADFVEENRAVVGQHEFAGLIADRAGERASHVAEQFAFQQRFRQRAAGHFHKRLIAPGAVAVDGAGDHRFAGAAFAGNQHGGFGVGHRFDHVENAPHAVIVPHDVFDAKPQVELRFQVFVFFEHFALIECAADGDFQFFVDQRLGEQIERAGPNGFDRRFDGAVAGNQNQRRGGIFLAGIGQQFETIAVGQSDVDQQQVELFAIQRRRGGSVIGGDVDFITLFPKPIGHRRQNLAIVVNQQK